MGKERQLFEKGSGNGVRIGRQETSCVQMRKGTVMSVSRFLYFSTNLVEDAYVFYG